MSTRYLIAAAFLLGSACGAQADVLPAASTAQSGFLSSWTTGSTDVASTGVLGSGTTLVGGGSAGVAQALYQKASANVGATDGKINLSLAEGLNGTYVVKTGNKALAALLSNGARVMTTADGVEVSYGDVSNSGSTSGGSSSGSGSSGGSTSGGGKATGGTTTGGTTTGGTTTGGNSTAGNTTGGTTGNGSNGSNGSTDVADSGAIPQLPSQINAGGGIGQGLPNAGPAAIGGEVPEPSSIALLMAGMMGALALTRRRAK